MWASENVRNSDVLQPVWINSGDSDMTASDHYLPAVY